VKVLDNEWHHIHYEGKVYLTGEVLDIKDKDFKPEVFVKVGEEEPKHVGVDLASQTETEVTITAEEPVSEEPKPKVSRRKTKF